MTVVSLVVVIDDCNTIEIEDNELIIVHKLVQIIDLGNGFRQETEKLDILLISKFE